MHIRRYTLGVMVFMIIVGWYIYGFITSQSVPIDLHALHLPSLPVAFWVLVPVFLLYLASVAHMLYYSVVGAFKLRKYQKDFDKLIVSFEDAYLGRSKRDHLFKTERYKLIGKLIDSSSMTPYDLSAYLGNEQIDKVFAMLRDIENGKAVDLKKFNLDKSNPIVVHNQMNQLEDGSLKPENVVNKTDFYDQAVCEQAFEKMIHSQPIYELEKYRSSMTKEALFNVLKSVSIDKNKLGVSNESLLTMISAIKLDPKEYIEATKTLSAEIKPEQRMKLFEILSEKDEKAMPAYLYTLFDLEMIDLADEILHNSQPDEYLSCKAYRALKEAKQNFSIDLFIK